MPGVGIKVSLILTKTWLDFAKLLTLDAYPKHGHAPTPWQLTSARRLSKTTGGSFEGKSTRLSRTLREQQAEAARSGCRDPPPPA